MLYLKKDTNGFERVVYGEVLIPHVRNVYGDLHTEASVRDFAYGFMIQGFGKDVNHDNLDRSGQLHVVESFIAREGDPDFIKGSWVVGMYIGDDDIWDQVLAGELNGYSYEALIKQTDVLVGLPALAVRYGLTEPDLFDQHTHAFFAILDDDGRVLAGGTAVTQDHRHDILTHTTTEEAWGHNHRYNLVIGEGL